MRFGFKWNPDLKLSIPRHHLNAGDPKLEVSSATSGILTLDTGILEILPSDVDYITFPATFTLME